MSYRDVNELVNRGESTPHNSTHINHTPKYLFYTQIIAF